MQRLSASGLDLLTLCGEAFRRKYIERERRNRGGIALTVGKSVHLAARVDLEVKKDSGDALDDEVIPDLAADAFEKTWDSEEIPKEEKDQRGAAKDQTIALEELHHSAVVPLIKPKALEEKITYNLPGYPFSLIGYLDVLDEDNRIRDTKTSAKTPKEDEGATKTQAAMYPYILEMTGTPVTGFTMDFLVKTKVPKVVHVESHITDFTHLEMRLDRAAKVIESGAFMPADPGHWKCSEKMCEFFNDCPWGSARRKAFGWST